ncbi:hypothetical protein T01_10728 [Trichinella spiralis]|uniref:Uncharacterized protein n=1 Tax=Trichinella spiralis TaxID=6334 RepID=A0A0V1BD30_TRISP|nr:hypothetical protein T01_10728 [Trichinella spiralis]
MEKKRRIFFIGKKYNDDNGNGTDRSNGTMSRSFHSHLHIRSIGEKLAQAKNDFGGNIVLLVGIGVENFLRELKETKVRVSE